MKKNQINKWTFINKILSVILVICMVCTSLQIKVQADEGIGYSVSMSVKKAVIGEEFDINIKLDNYSDYGYGIRGLQIDVDNIDADVLSVVSHGSLIDDSTAASNKTSYSESGEYIRLVYLSIDSTLDKSTSDVMNIRLKVNESLEAEGTIELPITLKIGTTNENITLKDTIKIDYVKELVAGEGECMISVDGVYEVVDENSEYTLPDTAKYGYYADGKMYKPGESIIIASDTDLTSVNEFTVGMMTGAAVRYAGTPGLRFQAQIEADNMAALSDERAITTGILMTVEDIYNRKGKELNLNSTYQKLNIVNSGWFNNTVGCYCGSVVNISKGNYIRGFIARAYMTINYADGTKETIYSDMSSVRSIDYVARAVRNAGYVGIPTEYISVIDSFILD